MTPLGVQMFVDCYENRHTQNLCLMKQLMK